MTKKGDNNKVGTPLHTTMNMTDDSMLCQTPLPFNGTMTTPMAQTDDDDKHDPAIPNASAEKPSRREDNEVRTVPNRTNMEQPW
jgi:hypothetical protein